MQNLALEQSIRTQIQVRRCRNLVSSYSLVLVSLERFAYMLGRFFCLQREGDCVASTEFLL